MKTAHSENLDRIHQAAVRNIIHHTTSKKYLQKVGAWILDRGEGAMLYDVEGREYLDAMSGGVFAVLVGYGREEIANAIYNQARKLNYTSPYGTSSVPTVNLALKLEELAPGDLTASFFCSSGSEAVEAAKKLAAQYHDANGESQRYKVVSLRRAYHGATMGALASTGWSPHFGLLRKVADPLPHGNTQAMPPYCYRCELDLTYPACELVCARTIEQAILGEDPSLVSAVILEPVMGTAGCVIPPPGYLKMVREICNRHGVLLILDEVVCGFGRTGTWFGSQHFDVVPDIMVLAKGMTSGYAPMAAAVASERIAEALPYFLNVHTYGGHPISAAAALANIGIIEREGLVENSATVGAYMLKLLEELRSHPLVGDVRGLGLLMAVELVKDPKTKEDLDPTLRVADKVAEGALDMGLFARPLGGNVLEFAPPLIFTREQAERSVDILDQALTNVERVVLG